MKLNDLLRGLDGLEIGLEAESEVTSLAYDTRQVQRGSLFFAIQGEKADGHTFAPQALDRGAVAVVSERLPPKELASRWVHVPRIRRALSTAGRRFYDQPDLHLKLVGITGTNGKTTTAFLTESLLNSAARSSVLIGTIECHIAGETRPSIHTTPESRDLFEMMAEGIARGAEELVTEVSSHALDQGRMIGIPIDVAVFTNFTRDHLDYHQTMESYFAAKRLLFDGTVYPPPRVAVINALDPRAEELAAAARAAGAEIRTYGIGVGEWRALSYVLTPSGTTIQLETPAGSACLSSRLAGEVNILNLLAAFTAAHARGISFSHLTGAVSTLKTVPGRFQPVDAGQPFTVVVDYAHTDDALRNLTALARQITAASGSRVITLFGCGGDRDRTKRTKMGEAAGEGSDFVVATSDNPRSEDPASILAEIEPGLQSTGVAYSVEVDRAAAIRLALGAAKPGDVVLLAGKGHEKEQILADRIIPFDDAQVALSILAELGYREGQ